MRTLIQTLYRLMDKGPLRALSLLMALLLAGCIFWDPSRFAAKTSELEIWHGLLLMWAVCAGVIHGVGGVCATVALPAPAAKRTTSPSE